MVSVENFYHVLYEHLLKPVNFNMRYYYPFGTCQTLMATGQTGETGHMFGMNPAVVLFHFDQEPIYPEDGPVIWRGVRTRHMSEKSPKLLANSERSVIKKEMCKEYDLLDWYYFYHGFAALDWYRDARYYAWNDQFDKVFLCFNHLVTGKRSYRMSLLARIIERDLQHQGTIAFHASAGVCQREIGNEHALISAASRDLISRYLATRTDLPFVADRIHIDGNASASFNHVDYAWRTRSMWSVVNETVFYDDKLHLTEKIFQPIAIGRPFFLVSAPGNLEYLRSYGFKTFGDYVDESYDLELDADKRMDKIVDQLQKLCSMSSAQLRTMMSDLVPILEHNKCHFFGKFREIISGELVENFNQCLRIWNNGRIDNDRIRRLHPEPEQVKLLLTS